MRGAIDRVGVVAVDHDARQPVGRGAVGGRMLHGSDVADRRIFHVEIVLADEDHRQLPHRGEIQRLVEGADVGGAVAEEAHRNVLLALVLRAPRRAAGDRQMRADDRVGAHHAVVDRGQMHRAALAAHQAVVALHQFAQHFFDRHAAGERMGMAAIGAEGQIAGLHGGGKAGGDRFLAERKMARALDQVLQKQIEGALLGLADLDLDAIQAKPRFLADIVVEGCRRGGRAVFDLGHAIFFGSRRKSALGGGNLAPLAKPRQRRPVAAPAGRMSACAGTRQFPNWRQRETSMARRIQGAPQYVQRFFGGPPLAVIGRLILLSILVGVMLAAIGLDP